MGNGTLPKKINRENEKSSLSIKYILSHPSKQIDLYHRKSKHRIAVNFPEWKTFLRTNQFVHFKVILNIVS